MDYNKMKKENHHNDQTLTQLKQTLTNREQTILVFQQYTRENCLIVPEIEKNEDTNGKIKDLARHKRGLNIKGTDLDKTHRIGKPEDGKPRPIFVKFAQNNEWPAFMKNRTKIKGSNKVGVNVLLTPYT